jgi:hypothetical protein
MRFNILDINSIEYDKILRDLDHDVYHLSDYILAEAKRINAQAEIIHISEGENQFLLPYLLRKCPSLTRPEYSTVCYDAVSPYGYPGFLLSQANPKQLSFLAGALQLLIEALRSRQVCSLFVRLHPILNTPLCKQLNHCCIQFGGTTVSINLKLTEAEQWRQVQPSRRTRINRCKRSGCETIISAFLPVHIPLFMDIYQDTMDRLEANESYYFRPDYYEVLAHLNPYFFICIIQQKNQPICAGLFTECCGIVQFHLSGTKTEFLPLSPSSLMLDEVRLWAKARGNYIFHLGGGLGSHEDSLFQFKASFSQQRHEFCTLRLITDLERYQNLVQTAAKQAEIPPEELLKTDFFPAYRFLDR